MNKIKKYGIEGKATVLSLPGRCHHNSGFTIKTGASQGRRYYSNYAADNFKKSETHNIYNISISGVLRPICNFYNTDAAHVSDLINPIRILFFKPKVRQSHYCIKRQTA